MEFQQSNADGPNAYIFWYLITKYQRTVTSNIRLFTTITNVLTSNNVHNSVTLSESRA